MALSSVAVFCGSSLGTNPAFEVAARALGAELVERQVDLVYGGASVGLMGVIADTVLEGGGHVVGVMPASLPEEITHRGLSELITTASMHERKVAMYERADACVALPGGFGTLEEVFELATWTQLGIHSLAVGLLNVAGYYDHLSAFLDRACVDGLLNERNRAIICEATTASGVLDQLASIDTSYAPKWG